MFIHFFFFLGGWDNNLYLYSMDAGRVVDRFCVHEVFFQAFIFPFLTHIKTYTWRLE